MNILFEMISPHTVLVSVVLSEIVFLLILNWVILYLILLTYFTALQRILNLKD